VTEAYGGIIGRAENREMVRALRLPFRHVRKLAFKNYSHFALVDTQPRTGNTQLPRGVVPDVVIDHHPLRKSTELALFRDVRPDYGATATILAEYLLASGLRPTHALATALVYAIRSETQDFAREYAGHDKEIYDAVFPQANHRLLARIQTPRLPLTYFSNLHEALERLETVDTLIVTHLGAVEQPDIVPEIADLLLRMEGRPGRSQPACSTTASISRSAPPTRGPTPAPSCAASWAAAAKAAATAAPPAAGLTSPSSP